MSKEKQLLYIDIAKGIAAIMVVWLHFFGTNTSVFPYALDMICVPLFFFISGYLFYFSINRYSIIDMIKIKFKHILIPFFLWSTVSLLFNLILSGGSLIKELHRVFLKAESVWYLLALFWVYIIGTLSKKISEITHLNIYVIGGVMDINVINSLR